MPKIAKLNPPERDRIHMAISYLHEARCAIQGDGLSDTRPEISRVWDDIVTARQKLQALLNAR